MRKLSNTAENAFSTDDFWLQFGGLVWTIRAIHIKYNSKFLLNNHLTIIFPSMGSIMQFYTFQTILFSMPIFCIDKNVSYKKSCSECALSLNHSKLRRMNVAIKVFELMQRNLWANICV